MSGPSKKSSPSSGKPENVLVCVERLRQQAEEFQRTIEEELRTAVYGELLICGTIPRISRSCYDAEMRDLAILFVHVIAMLA